jgi:hypothetical protein
VERHQHLKLPLGIGLALLLALNACSASKNQNPVASGDEVGSVSDKGDNTFSSGEEKPNSYTARKGDTLRKIAGRPEIYGDPNLWPILQEANADKVGHSMSVNQGVVLSIPRDLSDEQIQMAHEKARQLAAESKMGSYSKPHVAVPEPTVAAPSKEVPALPTAMPPAPVPMPQSHGILMPVLIVLLLILLGLGGVLFFYMRKERKEENE